MAIMNFMERLCGKVNRIPGLPLKCKMGYLDTGESFVIYPLPGSQTTTVYMDGASEEQLNFEFAMKSKKQRKIYSTLWLVQSELGRLQELKSRDGSYEFQELSITNKPFINYLDEQGWFVFLLDVQAKITVFKESEKVGKE